MKLSIVTLSTAAVLTAAAMQAPPAHAGASASNATGFCQGALPAFDTNIRKRPLGVNNEGTGNAFVSCSIPLGHNPDGVFLALVSLTNRGAVPVNVNCTFVNGLAAAGAATYYPKTVTLDPNIFTPLTWEPSEFALTEFDPYVNYSCNLPPGVELNVVGQAYSDTP